MKRYAIVRGARDRREAEAYLPDNYKIIHEQSVPADRIESSRRMTQVFVIQGEDSHGWTLDGYIIPRFHSVPIGCEEIDLSHPLMKQVPVERTTLDIRPGTVLPNGTTVIAASLRNADEWIVLAMKTGRDQDEYITWKCSRPGNGSDTEHGHYFDSLQDAVEDFYNRP